MVLTGRRSGPLHEACEAIDAVHPVQFRTADMADAAQVNELIGWIHDEIGPIDILVNNAGVNIRERRLDALTAQDWDYVMQVNANGAYYVVQAVLPAMRAQGRGLIINISSMAGVHGSSVAGAAYSASKHAVNALTQVISEEERQHGIRATAICPGAVNTPILDDRPVSVTPEQRRRILQPEDIAAAIMFVASLPERAHVPELHIVPAA